MTEGTQEHKTREQERSANLQTKAAGVSDDNSLQRSVPPLTGQTEIDEKLRIEAEFVSLEAIRRIAKKIAEDTSKLKPGLSRVLLGDEAFLAAVQLRPLVNARIELLERELKSFTSFAEVGADPFSGVLSAVNSLATLVSLFRADTTYKGREISIKQLALRAALVGQLREQKLQVFAPTRSNMTKGKTANELLSRLTELVELKAKAERTMKDGVPADRIKRLGDAVDELIKAFTHVSSDVTALPPLALLLAEAEDSFGLDDTVVLQAEIIALGGSYRTRRTLWSSMFTGDELSFSGGAAVSFLVFDVSDGSLLGGDTLFVRSKYRKSSEPIDDAGLASFSGPSL